jgi:hypothetical protein
MSPLSAVASEPKLTKKQINRAAMIYLLANTACMDSGGAETDAQARVMDAAIQLATDKLAALGLDINQVGTLDKCIAIATGAQEP